MFLLALEDYTPGDELGHLVTNIGRIRKRLQFLILKGDIYETLPSKISWWIKAHKINKKNDDSTVQPQIDQYIPSVIFVPISKDAVLELKDTKETKNFDSVPEEALKYSNFFPRVYDFYPSIKQKSFKSCVGPPFFYFLYAWVYKFLDLGYHRPLVLNDIWEIERSYSLPYLECEIPKFREKDKGREFFRILFMKYWKEIALQIIVKVVVDVMNLLPAYFIQNLIDLHLELTINTKMAILYSFGLFLSGMIQIFLLNLFFDRALTFGITLKTTLIGMITTKLYRQNKFSHSGHDDSFLNYITYDANKAQDFMNFGHLMWSGPFQIVINLIFLSMVIGVSPTLSAFGFLIVTLPGIFFVIKFMKRKQEVMTAWKDKRIKIVSSLLNGIKTVKFYAWEEYFKNTLYEIRMKEMAIFKVISKASSIVSFFWSSSRLWMSLVGFLVFSAIFGSLTTKTAFVALLLLRNLQLPLFMFGESFNNFILLKVSLGRIATYLESEEVDTSYLHHHSVNETDFAISVKNFTAAWSDISSSVIKNVNFTINSGELVAVVGSVASGKSALINGILGELYSNSIDSSVNVAGTIAYVPQESWIINSTVRENILFCKEYDKDKLDSVCANCCLLPDFELFPSRDLTIVGQNGVTLSGGQQQRISIARAVYSDADIIIMDDPLSALDAHVTYELFENVISNKSGVLKHKTRIIVTSRTDLLPHFDSIIFMDSGKCYHYHSYRDFCAAQENYVEQIQQKFSPSVQKSIETANDSKNQEDLSIEEENEKKTVPAKTKNPIQIESGSASFSKYVAYFKECGLIPAMSVLIFAIISQSLQVMSGIWLSKSMKFTSHLSPMMFIGGYSAVILFQSVFVFLTSFAISYAVYSASNSLHNFLTEQVLKLPMRYFDITPLGSILNNFSQDINVLDEALPRTLRMYFELILGPLISLISIIVYFPLFVIVILPLFTIFYFIQERFVMFSARAQRLNSHTKSPIYTSFMETFKGLTSVRAYQRQDSTKVQLYNYINKNNSCGQLTILANRLLVVLLETLIVVLILLANVILSFNQINSINEGIYAYIITTLLSFSQTLMFAIRMRGESDANIVSVERLKHYENLPVERIEPSNPANLEENWPNKGEIKFVNYQTGYGTQEIQILRDLNFTINSGTKIGIVGRTGAGKSSLVNAILRILEPSKGSIFIDDVDITQVNIRVLRSKCAVIPQNPYIFDGSLRYNLDPSSKYDDVQIYQALEKSHILDLLKRRNISLEDNLNSESGTALSVGERQLLCLARALLTNCKVVILDEATASLDSFTDKLMQQTIRSEFSSCTVLVVAHRINTILDSDKILVLDRGTVVEYDTPSDLLNNPTSYFKSLYDHSVETESQPSDTFQ